MLLIIIEITQLAVRLDAKKLDVPNKASQLDNQFVKVSAQFIDQKHYIQWTFGYGLARQPKPERSKLIIGPVDNELYRCSEVLVIIRGLIAIRDQRTSLDFFT